MRLVGGTVALGGVDEDQLENADLTAGERGFRPEGV
jgi:hypothetical protein